MLPGRAEGFGFGVEGLTEGGGTGVGTPPACVPPGNFAKYDPILDTFLLENDPWPPLSPLLSSLPFPPSFIPSFLPSFTGADTISLGNPLEDHRARRQFHWNLGLRGEVLYKKNHS